MKQLLKLNLLGIALLTSQLVVAAQNVVLVTLDGVRWQEVFNGADANLLNNPDFVKRSEELKAEFWHDDTKQRQQLLMPFITQTVAKQGVIIGDRNNGSTMSVSNP